MLLPSGPDTVRKCNLALRPYGNIYSTLLRCEMLALCPTFFTSQLFLAANLAEEVLQHLTALRSQQATFDIDLMVQSLII